MTAKTSLAELAVGDTIRWGCWVDDGTTTTVVGADAERIQVLNPDAGRIFGNRNRSPETALDAEFNVVAARALHEEEKDARTEHDAG
jgi:predicted secreted acid phosphatase